MTRRSIPLWAALAVMAMAAGCVPAPPLALVPAPADSGLRVMTFNVLGAQADGNVFSEHAGWAARIDQLRPDVLVLQEAQASDVSAVLGLTTSGYTLASALQWECDLKTEREAVAILVRSTIPVLGAGGTHVGESCVDPTVKRVLVWADLDLAGGSVRVYGTHLTAGGGAATESRNAQIRAIRRIIGADDVSADGRWLLAGDLNLTPASFSYRLMLGDVEAEPGPYRFADTFAETSPDAASTTACPSVGAADPDAMAFLLANPDHVRRCGYTAGWPKDDNWLGCDVLSLCVSWEQRRDLSVRLRIDYLLRAADGPIEVLRSFVPNRADTDWASTGAEWFRLSDHLPVVTDVAIGR